MEFGKGYKPIETTPQLSTGFYEAKIVKVEEKPLNWGKKVQVTVEINGHLGASPSKFDLMDIPQKEMFKGHIDSWNRNMTRFFDSFGIERGCFDEKQWEGKTGEVTVHPQGNASGYMEITPFKLSETELNNRIKKAEKKSEEAKQNKKNFEQSAPASAPSLDNFPESLPY